MYVNEQHLCILFHRIGVVGRQAVEAILRGLLAQKNELTALIGHTQQLKNPQNKKHKNYRTNRKLSNYTCITSKTRPSSSINRNLMDNEFTPTIQASELATPPANSATSTESVMIPVIEEQLRIDKQLIETGVVRISKHVIEESQTVDIPVFREEVMVEHVAVYQYVDTPPAVRYEGETMIVPVLREVLVTEKRLLLVEEVHVTKRHITDQETQEVTLRKEEVTVERSGPTNERSA